MSVPRELPSLEKLKELFVYDQETGHLIRAKDKYKTAARKGDIVGTPNSDGHLIVRVDYQICYVHRIIWKMVYGQEPPPLLDHKNRNKQDNRIENLRAATHQQNSQNRSLGKNNKTGVLGVYYRPKEPKKWKVDIKVNRKSLHLGYFHTKEEAVLARQKAEMKYYRQA